MTTRTQTSPVALFSERSEKQSFSSPIASIEPLESRQMLTVATSVDWADVRGQTTDNTAALGVWDGTKATTAQNASYQSILDQLSSGLVRYHNAATVINGSGWNWVDYTNKVWNASVVQSVFAGTSSHLATKMVNIPSWPSWMDTNSDGKLDTNMYDAFATFNAQLVTLVNVTNNYNVTYWEPFNEKDNFYSTDIPSLATIYNKCAAAMKAADPRIKVGGPAWLNSFNTSNIGLFLDTAGPNLDFFSYHGYGTSGTSKELDYLYGQVDVVAGQSGVIKNLLVSKGLGNVPVFHDEFNIYDTDTNDTTGVMRSATGGVFDALYLQKVATLGAIDSYFLFNDKNNTYGVIDDSYNKRPTFYVTQLANSRFVGQVVATTTNNSNGVRVLAVQQGSKKSVMLINRTLTQDPVTLAYSAAPQTATIDFRGWIPSNTAYTLDTITGTYTSTAQTFAAGTTYNLPANSVTVLKFADTAPTSEPIAPVNRYGWVATSSAATMNHPAASAIDGSTGTTFITANPMANGDFIQLDMKYARPFNRLTLNPGTSTTGYPRSYAIYASNNSGNFGSPIATGTGAPGLITVTFPLQNARYIKVIQTGTATTDKWILAEFNAYNDPIARSGWTLSASVNNNSSLNNIKDGNESTTWTTGVGQAAGQTLTIDTGASRPIGRLVLDNLAAPGNYSRGFAVYTSTDGVNFGTTVYIGSGSGGVTDVRFSQVNARYIRIVQTATVSSAAWIIGELNVFA